MEALIGAIGDEAFESRLIAYLHGVCGAEYCTIFQFTGNGPLRLISVSLDGTDTASRQASLYVGQGLWREDPSMLEAQQGVAGSVVRLLRLDIRSLAPSSLRKLVYERTRIRERILICGGVEARNLALSILRSECYDLFADEDVARLRGIAGPLLSILAKHVQVRVREPSLEQAMISVEQVQDCIVRATERPPRREAEVCARILCGRSSRSIALDLGVSHETVLTYRKRAYRRLQVSSQRELLLWYLKVWSSMPRDVEAHYADLARTSISKSRPPTSWVPRRAH